MFFKNIKSIDQLVKTAKILTANEYIDRIIKKYVEPRKGKVDVQFVKNILTDLLIPYFLSDPTLRTTSQTGSYTIWLYKTFLNVYGDDYGKGIEFLSDTGKLYEIEKYLKEHVNNKQNFPDEFKDINNIKSFEQLEDVVINIDSEKYQLDPDKADDINVLYNDDTWFVLEPLSHEAAVVYGRDTNWCTAARSKVSKEAYENWSPLTIIINKKTGEKWQTDPKSGWFNDSDDRDIDVYYWIKNQNIPDELSNVLQKRLGRDVFNNNLRNYIENSDMDERHKRNLFQTKSAKNFLNNILQNYLIWFSEEDIKNLHNAGALPDEETLDVAIQTQNEDVVKLVADLGAEPSSVSLEKAVYTQNSKIIKLVKQLGGTFGPYALHRAIINNTPYIVGLLLKEGVELDEDNVYHAMRSKNPEIIKLLFSQRELPLTAATLKWAIETRNLEIVEYIIQLGAPAYEGMYEDALGTNNSTIIELVGEYYSKAKQQFAGTKNVDELIEDTTLGEDVEEKTARINSIDELLKLSEEDFFLRIAKLGIRPSNELRENLETLYEWEYKYHQILYSQKTNPYRKEKLIEIIERSLQPIIDNVQEALLDTYEDWLNKHALLNPKDWAEARVDHDEFEAYGEEQSLANLKFEYERLGGKDFESDFLKNNVGYFKNFFREIKNDILNYMYEELDYAETHEDETEIERLEKEIEELENMDFDEEKDFTNFINTHYYIDEYMDEERANILFTQHSQLYDMIIDFLEKKVFPLWFAKWEPEGIVETRNTIEKIYNQLQGMKGLPFQKVPGVVNMALNASHQTGPMMDYIEYMHDVTVEDLEALSNKSEEEINKWNKELVEIGVW